jgi:hypothetical protein
MQDEVLPGVITAERFQEEGTLDETRVDAWQEQVEGTTSANSRSSRSVSEVVSKMLLHERIPAACPYAPVLF